MKVGGGLSKQESADVKAQMYRSRIVDDVKVVKTSVFGDERGVGSGGKARGSGLKRKTASAGLTVFVFLCRCNFILHKDYLLQPLPYDLLCTPLCLHLPI